VAKVVGASLVTNIAMEKVISAIYFGEKQNEQVYKYKLVLYINYFYFIQKAARQQSK